MRHLLRDRRGEIKRADGGRGPAGAGGAVPLERGRTDRVWKCRAGVPILGCMNYVLAILLPPLSILLAGRILLSIVVFVIWIPALLFSGGLTHPMFILLAWFIIFHAREDRRERRRD
jgi:hypothetical protein